METKKVFLEIIQIINDHKNDYNMEKTLNEIINVCKNKLTDHKYLNVAKKIKKKISKYFQRDIEYFLSEIEDEDILVDKKELYDEFINVIETLEITNIELNQANYMEDNLIDFEFKNFKMNICYFGDNEGNGRTNIDLLLYDNKITSSDGPHYIDEIIDLPDMTLMTKLCIWIMSDVLYNIFEENGYAFINELL
jgi:hypothetical protein